MRRGGAGELRRWGACEEDDDSEKTAVVESPSVMRKERV